MIKYNSKLLLASVFCGLLTTNIYSKDIVTEAQCNTKGDEFIFAENECIQYYVSEGDTESEINILVHGTWPEGTNTLARYAPFAENLAMSTDVTTIAVALPGYSSSSTNNFQALSHNGEENLAAQKSYITFLSELVTKLKEKYDATKVNYIGHSAGAMMGSTLTGFTPGLLDTITSAGGRYDIHEVVKSDKDLVSLIDYIDKVDSSTEFLLIYGTKDTISKPSVTKKFYQILEEKGLTATLIEVEGAPHLDLDMTSESVDAIVEMLDKE
ncbi:hypothetical protein ALC152_14090 [Arcobacter sp. 15-2]|uniref:alpha/beta hydrolase family protein n=1 Tax=Arcobacter sp. 15-2 TaxID=3374109 RepID=UPI00399D3285